MSMPPAVDIIIPWYHEKYQQFWFTIWSKNVCRDQMYWSVQFWCICLIGLSQKRRVLVIFGHFLAFFFKFRLIISREVSTIITRNLKLAQAKFRDKCLQLTFAEVQCQEDELKNTCSELINHNITKRWMVGTNWANSQVTSWRKQAMSLALRGNSSFFIVLCPQKATSERCGGHYKVSTKHLPFFKNGCVLNLAEKMLDISPILCRD